MEAFTPLKNKPSTYIKILIQNNNQYSLDILDSVPNTIQNLLEQHENKCIFREIEAQNSYNENRVQQYQFDQQSQMKWSKILKTNNLQIIQRFIQSVNFIQIKEKIMIQIPLLGGGACNTTEENKYKLQEEYDGAVDIIKLLHRQQQMSGQPNIKYEKFLKMYYKQYEKDKYDIQEAFKYAIQNKIFNVVEYYKNDIEFKQKIILAIESKSILFIKKFLEENQEEEQMQQSKSSNDAKKNNNDNNENIFDQILIEERKKIFLCTELIQYKLDKFDEFVIKCFQENLIQDASNFMHIIKKSRPVTQQLYDKLQKYIKVSKNI